jgi:ATP-dependent exoDNAse (exonuclease V) beta subunit
MTESGDARARERALDPRDSFIVQAPAGAGKTELLVQRFLALLAAVAVPEAIVAITFTVKAAGEMRERILAALAEAERDDELASAHALRTRALARAALERDRASGWNLADNPARLQIQTIDALCLRLARRLPVLARTGADLRITDRPRPLYRAAATMLAEEIEDGVEGELIATLLLHLDGDERRLVALVAEMLGERDRWLRHLARATEPAVQRAALERSLAELVRATLRAVAHATPLSLASVLPTLAARAGQAAPDDSPLAACRGLAAMPPAETHALAAWQGLAEFLLTANGEPRRLPRWEAGRDGDAPDDAWRRAAQALLAGLANEPEFVARLRDVRGLPAPRYGEEQWRVCEALLGLLPRAAACLDVVFAEAGVVDFTQIAHAALRALGEPDAPTDLALALDHRIEHLLVDEFQDTSFTQLELLARLTAGWTNGDGRTLFLVGDPMQSIYRFREAEVALFQHVQRRGLGALALAPLRLTRNFRAQAGLVEWVNAAFPVLHAARDAPDAYAVAFEPAEPVLDALEGAATVVHPQAPGDPAPEARAVLEQIALARREDPQANIAVLVRAREHLSALVDELGRNGVSFRAVDVQPLARAPVVQDLHALARALLHLADRVAWLAVLRAPWCGLTLADLHALTRKGREQTVWEAIVDAREIGALSDDGARRLARVERVLAPTLAERGREPLRRWIEGAWLALGGAACCRTEAERSDAQRYLRLLEDLDRGGEPARVEELDEALAELYADPDPSGDERLQLMTMHRAKGLEFDVVIVPSLGRLPGRSAERLLTVIEQPAEGGSRLLVAPIGSGSERDPIARWLRRLEKSEDEDEAVRLLYVAATRARRRLHLLGAAAPGATRPHRDSLLARLWPVVQESFAASAVCGADEDASRPTQTAGGAIRRLPADWAPSTVAIGAALTPPARAALDETPQFVWARDIARQVGRSVHRALEIIGRHGVERWTALGEDGQRTRIRAMLRELGTPRVRLEEAVARALRAVHNTLDDARGRWLLEHAHREAGSEQALSAWIDERLVTSVLDRTFVDEQGVRWIVDFKTGVHEGGALERFLDEEVERYRPQLDRYARLMRRMEDRPLRVGLYFPLLVAWREWEPAATLTSPDRRTRRSS